MIRQMLFGIVLGVLLIAALGVTKFFQIKAAIAEGAKHAPPPDAVTTVHVERTKWTSELHAVGTLAPERGAVLSAEEMGRVTQIKFEPGQQVKAGDVLVEFDVSVEAAQVKSAQAQRDLAQSELTRQRELSSKGAGMKATLDNAEMTYRTASAEIERLNSMIRRKTVVAPFAGRAGVRLVNPGEVLQPGTPVVSVQSLERLLLNFSLPQDALATIRPGQEVRLKVSGFEKENFVGTISAIEPNVDEKTRNVKVQAIVENSGERLRSGMFVEVVVVLDSARDVLAIPAPAVLFAPYGNSVYVVGPVKTPDGKEVTGVMPQTVKLGERRGDFIEVLSGLNPGQEIVSAGVFKLRPNAPVNIVETNPNPAQLQPSPANT